MPMKMGHAAKVVFVLIFLVLQGHSENCGPKDIAVKQSIVGRSSNGLDFIITVQIANNCACTISNLHILTNGFVSSTPVDPSAFRRDGDTYLVFDGKPIGSNGAFEFNYTFDHTFVLSPATLSTYQC
ncbi:hypothetical protein ACP70R_023427 [Stipagrostis hirtigluma subsp. patula]